MIIWVDFLGRERHGFFASILSSSFLLLLFYSSSSLAQSAISSGGGGSCGVYNSRFGWCEAFCRRAFGIYRPREISSVTSLGMTEHVYTRIHVFVMLFARQKRSVCLLWIQGPGHIRATDRPSNPMKSVDITRLLYPKQSAMCTTKSSSILQHNRANIHPSLAT